MEATLTGGSSQNVKTWNLLLGASLETLGGTRTILSTGPAFYSFDPDGSDRTVLLPAEADSAGSVRMFANWGSAGEQLNVKEDAGVTTIVSVEAGEIGIVVCDGTTWRGGVLLSGSGAGGAAAAIADLTAGTNITAATADGVLTDSSATNPSDAQFNELAKEFQTKINLILAALRSANIILT